MILSVISAILLSAIRVEMGNIDTSQEEAIPVSRLIDASHLKLVDMAATWEAMTARYNAAICLGIVVREVEIGIKKANRQVKREERNVFGAPR